MFCAGQERLETLLKSRSLFQEHTSSQEALHSVMGKLVVVEGDVQKNECGLSADDLARLRADVDIVIHSAASISFFEHIHVLLQQNYQVCPGCCSWSHQRALARQVDSSRHHMLKFSWPVYTSPVMFMNSSPEVLQRYGMLYPA